MTGQRAQNPTYYFIDIDLKSRQIINWGTETKTKSRFIWARRCHRVFLFKGQFNKLERQLSEN